MDGFEFQQFVAHLFEKLGLGKTLEIRQTSDAGRDIIMRSTNGRLIIIECKHQKGSVGRPVVQKLHSAVMTARAQKGVIVTTARFSNNAIKYANGLGSLIDLIDSRILYDMANKARIKLLKKGEKTTIYHVLPPAQELVEKKVTSHIIGNAISHPNTPSQLTKTRVIHTLYTPTYLIEYNLQDIFSTSVGRIHSVDVNKGRILIDGQDGGLIAPQLTSILKPMYMIENWYPKTAGNISSGKFTLDFSSTKKAGLKNIQQYHTQTVSYYGANNVLYTKTCVPRVSKIFIRSLTQVYIPIQSVSCEILTMHHGLSVSGNKNEVEILESKAGICEICYKELEYDRLLCNSCGRVVHAPRFRGHSYNCENCEKTICKECTYWTRKYLFFKKKLCSDCAEKLEDEGKSVNKLT
jgi:restriction system protein